MNGPTWKKIDPALMCWPCDRLNDGREDAGTPHPTQYTVGFGGTVGGHDIGEDGIVLELSNGMRLMLRVEELWRPDEWSGRTAGIAGADKLAGRSGDGGCNCNSSAMLLEARRRAQIQLRLEPHLSNRRTGEMVGLDHKTIARIRKDTETGASAQPITR